LKLCTESSRAWRRAHFARHSHKDKQHARMKRPQRSRLRRRRADYRINNYTPPATVLYDDLHWSAMSDIKKMNLPVPRDQCPSCRPAAVKKSSVSSQSTALVPAVCPQIYEITSRRKVCSAHISSRPFILSQRCGLVLLDHQSNLLTMSVYLTSHRLTRCG
jgi:hypothetical protein